MRRLLGFVAVWLLLALAVPARGDDHVEITGFIHYSQLGFGKYPPLGVPDYNADFHGFGGRISLAIAPRIQIEGEGNFDIPETYTERFQYAAIGSIAQQQTRVWMEHALFGARFMAKERRTRGFVTLKAGAWHWGFSPRPGDLALYTSYIQGIRTHETNFVLYPGAGVEFEIKKHWAIRVDAGDELRFFEGVHNTLRFTLGPVIRF